MDWGAVISPAFGFLGIGVGWFLRSWEIRHADLRRFDQQRRELYAHVLSAFNASAHGNRLLGSFNARSHMTPLEQQQSKNAAQALDAAEADLYRLSSEVALLGTPGVVHAFEAMQATLGCIPGSWSNDDPVATQRLREANSAIADARASFLRAVRTELGVD